MNIKFAIAASKNNHFPSLTLPEVAFCGRSNVGKSSLINFLTENNKLANTSSKPGRTQTINFFLSEDGFYLVDLPGYGYAKSSKTKREKWQQLSHQYLLTRQQLVLVCCLIDLSIPPQLSDLEFQAMLGQEGVPVALILTKADKLSKQAKKKQLEQHMQAWSGLWEMLPPYVVTSSDKRLGKEELHDLVASAIGASGTFVTDG